MSRSESIFIGRRRAIGISVMKSRVQKSEEVRKQAADLHWLAFLLTGRHDLSLEIVVDIAASADHPKSFFTGWIDSWARRLAIAKALAAVRDELIQSARRTELARPNLPPPAPRGWSLNPNTTKAQLEEALLSIDVFPRAAVVLTILEGVRMPDAATLLDADPGLVKKAQAIGLGELAFNFARRSDRPGAAFSPLPAFG